MPRGQKHLEVPAARLGFRGRPYPTLRAQQAIHFLLQLAQALRRLAPVDDHLAAAAFPEAERGAGGVAHAAVAVLVLEGEEAAFFEGVAQLAHPAGVEPRPALPALLHAAVAAPLD